MTGVVALKRVGYCQWRIDGPLCSIIVRRNGNRYQVFRGGVMIAGFFGNLADFPTKSEAVRYAAFISGAQP